MNGAPNTGCERWSDELLVFQFCEQFAGDSDTARGMLADTRKMYVEAYGEELGHEFWRASTCALLQGEGMLCTVFKPLREKAHLRALGILVPTNEPPHEPHEPHPRRLNLGEDDGVPEQVQELLAATPDPRVGVLRQLRESFGSPVWPPENRLVAGETVQVLCVDDENELLGVFDPEAPLRGGADLERGIGGWWMKERCLCPAEDTERTRKTQ